MGLRDCCWRLLAVIMASHYPRWRISITACVLLTLGYLLLRLPLDQKSYARESSKYLRKQEQQRRQEQQGKKKKAEVQKGGMVRLSELKSVPVNHDGSGAKKQVPTTAEYICCVLKVMYDLRGSTLPLRTTRVMLLLLHLCSRWRDNIRTGRCAAGVCCCCCCDGFEVTRAII